ncbi:MAG: ion transporter [Ktedonobacteraceae bacterium]
MPAKPSTEKKTIKQKTKKITAYDLVIGILAIFSLVILIIPLIVKLPPDAVDTLDNVENALCVIFLADFLRSLFRAQSKWGYFLKGGGWIDLLGSIPFGKLAIFRFARLFRIARVMRTLKGNDFRKMLTDQLAQSTLLFTFVVALLLIFTIAFFVLKAEQGNPDANITTYTNAVWWAFVTITTVGYGDYYPVTTVGRLLAIILMFAGLGIIGVLSSYLASTFISLQKGREKKTDEGNGNGENKAENEEGHGNDEDETSSLKAQLAAMEVELTEIKGLLEKMYQVQ